ncbi:MAG: cysteine hydrolase [Chloroflexi bacterium]|nr:cysteine hydrolase [Chloroflexota bacterium]
MRMKEVHPIEANPANTLLVVVDVQNDFAKVGGLGGASSGPVTPAMAKAMAGKIAVIRGLVEKARATGVRVMYIQSVRTHEEPEFTIFNYPKILKLGSWGAEIVDELKPQEGEVVIQKFCHNPFYKTNIEEVLERLVPDPTKHQAIITGGGIHVCAYDTIMGFYFRNYWTVVPTDGVYGGEEGMRFAMAQFSMPVYPNIFLTRSDLVHFSRVPKVGVSNLVPNT